MALSAVRFARIPDSMCFSQNSYDNLDQAGCGGIQHRRPAVARDAFIVLVVAIGWFGSSGCEGNPAVVALEGLAFPVVRITGTAVGGELASCAVVITNREDLGLMRVELFSPLTDTTRSDPPFVIDSTGRVSEMRDLKGQHGGFWMMMNPTGQMPITFSLVERKATGIEASKELLAGCRYLGHDLDQERTTARHARIAAATTMAEIVAIVEEVPAEPSG